MRVSLILVVLMVSVNGYAQTGWKTFPKNGEESQEAPVAKEGVLSDTMILTPTAQPINAIPGTLEVTVSPEIIEIDNLLKEEAKNDSRINGFTILIFSGSGANSKNNAYNRQIEFKELFPDYVSHLTWKSPNYEVRIGDFRTKIEAEKVLQDIKSDFPSAIVRADKIELPALNEPK